MRLGGEEPAFQFSFWSSQAYDTCLCCPDIASLSDTGCLEGKPYLVIVGRLRALSVGGGGVNYIAAVC